MIGTVILGLMVCKPTVIVNTSYLPWNKHDQTTMKSAEKTCNEVYPKSNPCLKWFKKYAKQDYSAICGPSVPVKDAR